jgi:hypothetical protein
MCHHKKIETQRKEVREERQKALGGRERANKKMTLENSS